MALAAVAAIALIAITARRGAGVCGLAAIDTLRGALRRPASDDSAAGRALGRDLIALTRRMPRLAQARARLETHLGDIIDGGDPCASPSAD
jgi:putative membrane protein